MRMLPAGYFIFLCSARPAGLCTTAPAFHRPATKPLTVPAAGSLSYCSSSLPLPPAVHLSHRSDRFRRVLSICPAMQAGASPLFYSVRLHTFGAVLLLHTVMSHSQHHLLPQPLSARCSFLFCPAIMRCPIPGAASNLLCILSFRVRRPRG